VATFCSHIVQIAIGDLTTAGWQNSFEKRAAISIGFGSTTGSTTGATVASYQKQVATGQVS
jgi:hypothetical protein